MLKRLEQSHLIAATFFLVCAALWVMLVQAQWLEPDHREIIAAAGRIPLLLIGLVLAWKAVLREQNLRWRMPWLFVTLAFCAVTIGEAVWSLRQTYLARTPGISISDWFFLSYFVLVLIGLVRLPRVFRSRNDVAKFALDALVVAIGGAMVMWFFGLRPSLVHNPGANWEDQFLALAYPLGDLLSLLGIGLVLLRLPQALYRSAYLWLAIAILFSLAGDMVYASGQMIGAKNAGKVPQFFWLLQALAFVMSARHALRAARLQTEHDQVTAWQSTFEFLPNLALITAFGLLAWVAQFGDMGSIRQLSLVAVLLAGTIVLRQWLAQMENANLLAAQVKSRDEARFAAMVENASDGIILIDPSGRTLYQSAAVFRMMGKTKPRAVLLELVHPDDQIRVRQIFEDVKQVPGLVRSGKARVRAGDGQWLWVEAVVSNLLDHESVQGLVVNVRDISEQFALHTQMQHDALHHEVSGLPNRLALLSQLRLMMDASESSTIRGVMVLVLDQLQLVNESLGHLTGEALVVAASERLQNTFELRDLSQSADGEFAIAFDCDERELQARIERLRQAFAHPLQIGEKVIHSSLSVGVALSEHAVSAEELMRNAEIALQRAVQNGRDRVEYFKPKDHAEIANRFELIAALPEMIQNNAFRVMFKPYVDVLSNAPVALEVDLGWADASRSISDLQGVLDVADESGVAAPLLHWTLSSLRRDLSALMRYQSETLGIAVIIKLSPRQLLNANVVQELEGFIRALEMRVRNLNIQVVNLETLHDRERMLEILRSLQAAGVNIVVGNAGEQLISLATLDALQIRAIKISPVLLPKTNTEEIRTPIIRGVVALARATDMRMLAVNVRSEAELTQWKSIGVDWAAGDFVGASMPYEKLLLWLGRKYAEA